LYNPTTAINVVEGLEKYAEKEIDKNIEEIRGCIWR
jgi:dihydroorotate dehydrogenase (NAD+) catalytic subunit